MRISLIILLLTAWGLLEAQIVPYNLVPDWISQPNGQIATGLGLADIDGDGYKDLVIANGNDIQRQRLTVHYNDGQGHFNINPDWQSDDVDYHGHLACGDLDSDGDLDVVVSVYIGPSGFSSPGELKIYYNQGTELEANPSFISDPFYTFSCALGDADADGDLDIAAVAGEPYGGLLDHGKIFINNNGTFQPGPDWQSDIEMGSLDVEFGDFNRDGFLDVIFVCEGTPNVIYLAGDNGIIDTSPDWQSEEALNYINSVDVGYTGSGSVVVMTENDQLGGNGQVRKYDFSGPIPGTSTASWYSNPFGYGSGIVLNDVDLDGNTDLIYGGWWLPVKIALGDGTGFELTTSYTSSTSSVVEAIQLADLDRVDEEILQQTFTIPATQDMTNLIVLNPPIVEGITDIQVNGEFLTVQQYKHLPGKPWIILSDPMKEGDVVSVSYRYSPYPDMVVTNWDSNKGDYIFYNTESSVDIEEEGGKEARGHGKVNVWPVPAKEKVFLSWQTLAIVGINMRLEIYNILGHLVHSMDYTDGKVDTEINLDSWPAGAYTVILKDAHRCIARGTLIKIQ